MIDCDIRDRVSSEDGCDGWLSYVRIEKFDANQTKYIVAAQQKIQAAARWYGPIGAPITRQGNVSVVAPIISGELGLQWKEKVGFTIKDCRSITDCQIVVVHPEFPELCMFPYTTESHRSCWQPLIHR